MRVDAALRLLAVPLCGALVYAAVMPVLKGLSATSLFTGLLYGFIVSMVVGIPLLLVGDRFFPASKARHIVSSLLQSLLIYVVYGGFSGRLLLVAIVGGLVLGLLYTAVAKGIERYAAKHQERQQGKAYVLGIPLCGGIPVAVVITSAIDDGSGTTLTSWILFFLVGAGLSMLAGWPVLWLTERFLTTRWRYVIGGVITGLLLWLLFGVPGLRPTPVAQQMNFLMYQIKYGVLLFVLMGCVSGLLFTGFHWVYSRLSPRKEKPLD